MKRICIGFLMLFSAFIFSIAALAQSDGITKANVPFAFYAGSVEMPAGAYTVRVSDDNRKLLVRNADGSAATFLIALPVDSSSAMRPSLRFDRVGDTYFLRAASDSDQEYDITKPKTEKQMERNGVFAQSTYITSGQ